MHDKFTLLLFKELIKAEASPHITMRYITTVLMLPWYQVLAGVSQCAVRYTTAQTCQGGDGRKLLNILENTHINFLSVLLVDCSVLQASFILYKYGKRTVFFLLEVKIDQVCFSIVLNHLRKEVTQTPT